MIYHVDDEVRIIDDSPLSGNRVAPPVVIGDTYPILHIIEDSKGHQHLDLGIKSEYDMIRSWETGEELPDGDKIHWISPFRVEIVINKKEYSLPVKWRICTKCSRSFKRK